MIRAYLAASSTLDLRLILQKMFQVLCFLFLLSPAITVNGQVDSDVPQCRGIFDFYFVLDRLAATEYKQFINCQLNFTYHDNLLSIVLVVSVETLQLK